VTVPVFDCPERDPGARGAAIGAAWRAEIARTWGGYERLFAASGAGEGAVRDAGERALERAAEWAPALGEEIAALAAASGLEPWQAGALNGRTELLAALHAAAPECSTVVTLPAGGGPPRTVQTWDWHDHLRGNAFACRLRTGAGRTVRLFTEYGVVGKIGLNDAGLGLHFNILGHDADGGPPGVPVHVVARRVLDEAATIEEAVSIAASAEVSASTVLTVATWDGERADARCLELSPAGLAQVRPRDGALLHTNHFLDPGLAAGDRMAREDQGSHRRIEELERRLPALRAAAGAPERAAALLSHDEDGDGAPLCCHPAAGAPPGERWETLMTLSLDLGAGRLRMHEGGPCGLSRDGWSEV
jgi:isopenicillin-N N-acyltransferase like protein